MKASISSVIIVAVGGGYVASLRFTDPKLDEDISADSKWAIYERIDKAMQRRGLYYAGL